MNNIRYTFVTNNDELEQIIALQEQNILNSITADEVSKEGFVTVRHTLALLNEMNDAFPHIIAKDDDKVVGYALSMTKEFASCIDVLVPMFELIDQLISSNYMVMGQICIDRNYRKKGIFRGLYNKMKTVAKPQFEEIITEVDATNLRSLNAHKAVGFEAFKEYRSDGQDWVLLSLKT